MTNRADLIDQLRARAEAFDNAVVEYRVSGKAFPTYYRGDALLDREAADALSAPVTELELSEADYAPWDFSAAQQKEKGNLGLLINVDLYLAMRRDIDRLLSRPAVTEEMVARAARVLADAIGEPVYTAETADVVRHILTAALGTPNQKGGDANPNEPGHDNAKPRSPDTAGGAERSHADTGCSSAQMLAREISEDVMAGEAEIAAAIERGFAAIRAEATAAERERAELLALRERDKWPKGSVLWDAFDLLAAAIRGGGHD